MDSCFVLIGTRQHSAILVPRALVSFGQRLKRGALVTLPSGCHNIYDIR